MSSHTLSNIRDDLDAWGCLSLASFAASLPVLLPCLDALHGLAGSAGLLGAPEAGEAAPFLWTMPLAAMFTALAILFICLLKTTYLHLAPRLVMAGAGTYLIGYTLLACAIWQQSLPHVLSDVSGVLLGFGLAIICLAWIQRFRFIDFRSAFLALVVAFALNALVSTVALLVAPKMGIAVFCVLAILGVTGTLRRLPARIKAHAAGQTGSNWWDVFGKLDISLVEGTDEIAAPASRVLFFVVTPLIMLLLFVVNRSLSIDRSVGFLSCASAAVLLAVLLALPLLFLRSDQALINVSYRLYLPLIAFMVFVVNSFLPEAREQVMGIGISVYCALYFLVLASMVLTMAGHMRSLRLPACSFLLIAISLVSLLSYTEVEAGALMPMRLPALMVLFVVTVALLLLTPGSHMWRIMIEGLPEDVETAHGPSYQSRCEQVAGRYGLTAREAEILVYLGRGHSSAYVADQLVVAESTIRSHRKNIYRKLGIGSREELLELLDSADDDDRDESRQTR